MKRIIWVDDTTVEGTAETTFDRSDFGIGIPNVPSVAMCQGKC